MKHVTITCDICGVPDAIGVDFYVDRQTEGAGSKDDHYETIDLCIKHILAAYKITERQHGFLLGRTVYNELRSRADAFAAKSKSGNVP